MVGLTARTSTHLDRWWNRNVLLPFIGQSAAILIPASRPRAGTSGPAPGVPTVRRGSLRRHWGHSIAVSTGPGPAGGRSEQWPRQISPPSALDRSTRH